MLTKTGNTSVINMFPFISYLQIGNYASDAVFYNSKNNVISSNSIYSDGSYNRTYDYVYDENNYPISAEIEYTYPDEPERNTTIYKTWTYETF